jgi:hypothetical protein
MSVIFKIISCTVMASYAVFGFDLARARSGSSVSECSSSQECIFHPSNNDMQSKLLCESSNFSVVWKKESTKYLIQCRSGDSAEDNVIWVAERKRDFLRRLNFGRFIEKDMLMNKKDILIHDKFSSRKLCHPVDVKKLQLSDFILLNKRSTGEDDPYCYDVNYLAIVNGKLSLSTNAGPVRLGDANYPMSSVDAGDRLRINKLLDALTR